MRPTFFPAARAMDSTRWEVVVLPLVPVTPTRHNDSSGRPHTSRARRPAAPAAGGSPGDEPGPVPSGAGEREEQPPSPDPARVETNALDLRVRAEGSQGTHVRRAQQVRQRP